MDLKNNRITIRELMNHPGARAVLQRRFPQFMNLPIVATSGNMTLEKAVTLAAAYVPQAILRETVQELQRL